VAAVVAERAAAQQATAPPRCPPGALCSAVPDLRMSQTRSSYEPTRLTAGQAATTAPTRPWDQPWAMFAVRVAAIPKPSSQRARDGIGPGAVPRTAPADCFGKLILLVGSAYRTEIGSGETGVGHGLLLHDRLGGIWEIASGANRPEPALTGLK